MIFVGIDISIDSTAMCIEKNDEKKLFNYTTNKPTYKWNKLFSNNVIFRYIDYDYKREIERIEMDKLNEFYDVNDMILNDLLNNIDDDVCIGIEGFNYGLTNTNIIVDIVEFSTMLKININENFFKYKKHIEIISPKSIKKLVCEYTYGEKYIQPKTKKIFRNSDGIPGGSFQKSDMLKAMLDYDMKTPITVLVKENINDLIAKNGKDVRKPVDDIVDSIWICEIVKKHFQTNLI